MTALLGGEVALGLGDADLAEVLADLPLGESGGFLDEGHVFGGHADMPDLVEGFVRWGSAHCRHGVDGTGYDLCHEKSERRVDRVALFVSRWHSTETEGGTPVRPSRIPTAGVATGKASPHPRPAKEHPMTRIVSVPDLLNLPVGSIVRAHFRDGTQDDHHSVRIDGDHMAATGGWSLRGGRHWANQATWGPEVELTVVSIPTPDQRRNP